LSVFPGERQEKCASVPAIGANGTYVNGEAVGGRGTRTGTDRRTVSETVHWSDNKA